MTFREENSYMKTKSSVFQKEGKVKKNQFRDCFLFSFQTGSDIKNMEEAFFYQRFEGGGFKTKAVFVVFMKKEFKNDELETRPSKCLHWPPMLIEKI